MATWVNGAARAALGVLLRALALVFELEVRWRIRRFAREQARLHRAYGLRADTPVRAWGPEVQAAIDAYAARHPDARFACTSGSTATPKRVAFTRRRLRAIERGSLSALARLVKAHGVRHPVLFILASLKDDDSLTSLLLEERSSWPPWAKGLLAPSAYLGHPALRAAVGSHGATAVRLWLALLANPTVIYGTNPSTLAGFLDALEDDWPAARRLASDFARGDPALPPALARIARRVAARGSPERLALAVTAPARPPLERLFPALRFYTCWDGGYVRPFIERIEAHLPRARYRMVPMYAMSTETVMTVHVFEGERARLLPLAPGVRYEMLEDGAPDDPARLIECWQLEPGREYAMVVSDGYGLTRYQTRDVFLCRGLHRGLPDLHFLRRQGLAFSFTGEKLTGEQVTLVHDRLRAALPAALGGLHLTCLPSREPRPHYRLVVAHGGASAPPALDPIALARRFDDELSRVNAELAAKLESGRLGAARVEVVPYADLAARLDAKTRTASDREHRAWESQFKLLPLYTRAWEDVMGPPGRIQSPAPGPSAG